MITLVWMSNQIPSASLCVSFVDLLVNSICKIQCTTSALEAHLRITISTDIVHEGNWLEIEKVIEQEIC